VPELKVIKNGERSSTCTVAVEKMDVAMDADDRQDSITVR